jgi:microcystin degradation protein MlrC
MRGSCAHGGPVAGANDPHAVGHISAGCGEHPEPGHRASPCRDLFDLAETLRSRTGVVAVSVCLGFPYADVAEMGTSFVVTTDGDPALARDCAAELAAFLVEHRHDFDPRFITPEKAVERAVSLRGPVCLLDTGDNVGGGSAGDGTVLAHLLARRRGLRSFVCIYDPESVRRAANGEQGERLPLEIGGKSDDLHGAPLQIEVAIRGRHDGSFTEPEVRHGGTTHFDMGETVIVESDASPPYSSRPSALFHSA